MKRFKECESHFLVTRLCRLISGALVLQFSPVPQRKRARSLHVRLRVKEKVLPSHRTIDLHITLDGVNAVIN